MSTKFYPQNNAYAQDNRDQMAKQQEQQIFKDVQKQEILRIQYYVYQDLANFLGALFEVSEVLEHFQFNPQHQFVNIAINRFIIQSNLSQIIHFDCSQHNSKNDLNKIYQQEKKEALQMFQNYVKDLNYFNQPQIAECVKLYQKIGQNGLQNQRELLPTEAKGDFNIKVVEKVFAGQRDVDKIQQKINQGTYKKLTKEEIHNELIQRKLVTKEKLNQNFRQYNYNNNQGINNSNNYIQEQDQENLKKLNEMKKQIYQNLIDVLCAIQDIITIQQYFSLKQDQNYYQQYLEQYAINNLIQKSNFQSAIHFSCCKEYKDQDFDTYFQEMQEAFTIFYQIYQQKYQKNRNAQVNLCYNQITETMNNIIDKPIKITLNTEATQQKIYDDINSQELFQKYQSISMKDLRQILEDRNNQVKNQLMNNFSKKNIKLTIL